MGNLSITSYDRSLNLSNVFYVLKLAKNRISVGQLVDQGCIVWFWRYGCVVQDLVTGKVLGRGKKVGRLFYFDLHSTPQKHVSLLMTASKTQINASHDGVCGTEDLGIFIQDAWLR